MDCRPGLRSLPGVVLSHGYCYFHGLEVLERNGIRMTTWERVQLAVLRFFRRLS